MKKKEIKKIIKEIINEIELDRSKDHLDDLKVISQQTKIKSFKIDDTQYNIIVRETYNDENDLLLSSFSFINVTAGKNVEKEPDETMNSYARRFQQSKTGLTGTGNQMRLFNEIYNIFIKYIEKFKPKFVGYEAIEENRRKLYVTMMKRAEKQSGQIRFEKLNKNPISGENSNPTEFYFEVEYL